MVRQVKEMESGNECGVTVEDFSEWRQGDKLQVGCQSSLCAACCGGKHDSILEYPLAGVKAVSAGALH